MIARYNGQVSDQKNVFWSCKNNRKCFLDIARLGHVKAKATVLRCWCQHCETSCKAAAIINVTIGLQWSAPPKWLHWQMTPISFLSTLTLHQYSQGRQNSAATWSSCHGCWLTTSALCRESLDPQSFFLHRLLASGCLVLKNTSNELIIVQPLPRNSSWCTWLKYWGLTALELSMEIFSKSYPFFRMFRWGYITPKCLTYFLIIIWTDLMPHLTSAHGCVHSLQPQIPMTGWVHPAYFGAGGHGKQLSAHKKMNFSQAHNSSDARVCSWIPANPQANQVPHLQSSNDYIQFG